MNKYESVILIDPNVDENGINELIQKFSDLINSDGNVVKVTDMGKRKTAYPVKKNKEAFYYEILFEANPQLINEIERVYRITDEVIKFLIIRREGELVSTLDSKPAEVSESAEESKPDEVDTIEEPKEVVDESKSKVKKKADRTEETKEAEDAPKAEETDKTEEQEQKENTESEE